MRAIPLLLALCCGLAAADTVPAPAPAANQAGDVKAQAKELEMKLKAMREQVLKDDPELSKLKTEADDARKRFETAAEAKMKDNADYQAVKAQLAELKNQHKEGGQKKEGEKKDAPKH